HVVWTCGIVDLVFGARSRLAAEYAPRRILMPVGFMRDEAWRQEPLGLYDALSAAEPAGARHHVVAQFVSVADQRQMHAEIFERVVAGVAHQLLDRVGAVRLWTPAHRGFVDFEEDPIFAVQPNAGEGRE